jgi:hypothetical protein
MAHFLLDSYENRYQTNKYYTWSFWLLTLSDLWTQSGGAPASLAYHTLLVAMYTVTRVWLLQVCW